MTTPEIDLEHRFEPTDPARWEDEVARILGDGDASALDRALVDGVTTRALYVEAPERSDDPPGAPPFVRGSHPRRVACELVAPIAPGTPEELRAQVERIAEHDVDRLLFGPAVTGALPDIASLKAAVAGVDVPVLVHADSIAWAADDESDLMFDPFGSLARGALTTSLSRALQQLREAVRVSREQRPSARPILVDTRPAHDAGASAVDELALGIAMGLSYLRELSRLEHPLLDLPSRMTFAFSLDADQFVGIAKLRAARWLWSKVLRATGIDGPEQGMRVHAFGSRRALGRLDPHVNVLRGTVSAFAAICGGADRITVEPFDGSAHAAHLARNTVHLLREEAALDRVVDPGGGSYHLEALTEALARNAWAVLQEVEHLGGAKRGMLDGSLEERVARSAEARRSAIRRGERARVGEDRPAPEATSVPAPSASPPAVSERSPRAVRDVAEGPGLLEALRKHADAPLSELRHGLAHGDERDACDPWPTMREGEDVERLMARAAALPEERRRVALVVVKEKKPAEKTLARLRRTLRRGGLRLGDPRSANESSELEAEVVLLVGPAEPCTEIAKRLQGSLLLLHAGEPDETLEEAGVERFVHPGADEIDALERILSALEQES